MLVLFLIELFLVNFTSNVIWLFCMTDFINSYSKITTIFQFILLLNCAVILIQVITYLANNVNNKVVKKDDAYAANVLLRTIASQIITAYWWLFTFNTIPIYSLFSGFMLGLTILYVMYISWYIIRIAINKQ